MSVWRGLRREVIGMLEQVRALNRPSLDSLPVELVQTLIQDTLIANADPERPGLARIENIQISGGDDQPMAVRLYVPRGDAGPGPAMLFLHGGGFITGSVASHHGLASEIAGQLGIAVVSVEYRLAPQHPYPAALDDAMAALRWLAASSAVLGHEVTGLIVGGDSAGGNLAAVCAQHSGSLPVPILVQWLMYASVEAEARGGSIDAFAEGFLLTAIQMKIFRDSYYGSADRSAPSASPTFVPDLGALPAAMIFTCDHDPLRDQARDYATKLVRHGVSVRYREGRGLVHGAFTQLRCVPSARGDLAGCVADVRSLLDEAQHRRALLLDQAGR